MSPSLAARSLSQSPASPLLWPRDAASSFADAKTTLSSWDGCMSKTYCKWPVIVVIIIGALIVLSLLFCCFRCLCCGLECCCGCFSCCNACCPSPRGSKRDKNQQYQPAPQQPPYNYPDNTAGPQPWHPSQQYGPPQPQQQDPMMYGAKQAPTTISVPQFARFSNPTPGKGGKGEKGAGDALPAMPSWSAAEERRIEDTSYHGASVPDKEIGGVGGEEGIPLQDRKSPMGTSRAQPSTFGTKEYEQGFKSLPTIPSPPVPQDEYSTGQHDGMGNGAFAGGAAAGGAAAGGMARHDQQRRDPLSPPPAQGRYGQPQAQGYGNTGFHHQQQPNLNAYPSRTVSPISTISSPPHTQSIPQASAFSPQSQSQYQDQYPTRDQRQRRYPPNPNAQIPLSPEDDDSSMYTARPPPSYHTYAPAYPQSQPQSQQRSQPPYNQSDPRTPYSQPTLNRHPSNAPSSIYPSRNGSYHNPNSDSPQIPTYYTSQHPSQNQYRSHNQTPNQPYSPATPVTPLHEADASDARSYSMYNIASTAQQQHLSQQNQAPPMPVMPAQYSAAGGVGRGNGGTRGDGDRGGERGYQPYKPYTNQTQNQNQNQSPAAELDGGRDVWR